MSVTVSCTSCNKGLMVRDELIGKEIRCPACKGTFMCSPQRAAAGRSPAMPPSAASAFMQTNQAYSGSGSSMMNGTVISGIVMMGIGGLLTGGSYALASSSPGGGRYFVFYGLIVAGGFRLIRGLAMGND